MSNKPYFVISLDFELFWGMFDKVTLEEYGANIAGVHTLIPKLLEIFEDNQIHSTWAAVGMLAAKNKAELLSLLPPKELRPLYPDQKISAYFHIENFHIGEDANEDKFHFGRHLIEKIISTPYQELGSHTFSHYYCIDGKKNNDEIFAADCAAFKQMMSDFNIPIKSIVFPRNQTIESALKICQAAGFTTYRGTPNHFLYNAKNDNEQTNIFLRILRLFDAYINLSKHHTYKCSTVNRTTTYGLINIPASRFFRPFNPALKALESLKIRRIKTGMTHAAKKGEVFHLWWHPHNFGINQEENLTQLKEIIEHYHSLNQTYGMESRNMAELATLASEPAASGTLAI